ncbi:protein rep, partial [Cytobacillus oceanisediminis]|uniref:protein rep n=1 Tax=Cytobacillus oceanisediminis TaxID=665099 RepID=UPI001CCC88D5
MSTDDYSEKTHSSSTDIFLIDKSKNGKERPWRDKKMRTNIMSEVHDQAGIKKKAERMANCGDTLFFKKMSDGSRKLERAYFCKARLCPMCTWRRSLKITTQNHAIIKKANENNKLNWLLLTLTTKNPLPHELKGEIDRLMAGWNRLVGYKRFDKPVIGWFRALEITKNRDEKSKDFGTYNPHFHVLIAVKPSYFKKKDYIKQKEWSELWSRAMKLDYEPRIDVRRVKPSNNSKESLYDVSERVKGSIEEFGAILEVSKYAV